MGTGRESRFPPRAGEVIAGKYAVDGVIGSGGMGVVMAATNLRLGTPVALKMLSPASLANPKHRARFLREAHAAARLRSEHVGRVLDIEDLRPGVPFIVMELLEGSDLAELQRQKGVLPPDEAVAFILQACEGVAEAHAAGIIHRDLKPSNLFVTRRADGSPLVKLLDFGISKLREATSPELALTGKDARLGSPEYMAPEQRRAAADVDHRADVWSLGVVLYELLAGRSPFSAGGDVSVTAAAASQPMQPIARADVPAALEAAIGRCLAKSRAERWQSVAELAEALAPFAPDGGAAAARVARVLSEPSTSPRVAPTLDEPPPSGPVTADLDEPPAETPPVVSVPVERPTATTSTRWLSLAAIAALVLAVLIWRFACR